MAEENGNPQAEGPGTPGEGEAAEIATPKKKKMLLIISGAVAVVGILVAVGVVFFMGGEKHEEDAAHSEAPAVAIYEVPEFNLSLLSDDPTTQHFIKIKISLELVKHEDMEAVTQMLPRLQDDWGGFLRQMRIGDMQGSANLQRLKEGLLRRANQSLDPVEIKAVYIRELLVQ